MQRRPWFELHDHPLFPRFLRDLVTEALEAVWNEGGVYRPIVSRLCRALDQSRTSTVVDLCSGGGGPWLTLIRECRRTGHNVSVCLTDKYPNLNAFARARAESHEAVRGWPEPIDATEIPPQLSGLRTIFSSFHHFSPADARAILACASLQRQGIAVFEAAQCTPRTLACVGLVPLLALLTTPHIRPFRLSRLLFTYLIPVIPAVLLVDGILSCLRSYSPADLKELIDPLTNDGYRWHIGEEHGGRVPILYLIGLPDANCP